MSYNSITSALAWKVLLLMNMYAMTPVTPVTMKLATITTTTTVMVSLSEKLEEWKKSLKLFKACVCTCCGRHNACICKKSVAKYPIPYSQCHQCSPQILKYKSAKNVTQPALANRVSERSGLLGEVRRHGPQEYFQTLCGWRCDVTHFGGNWDKKTRVIFGQFLSRFYANLAVLLIQLQ